VLLPAPQQAAMREAMPAFDLKAKWFDWAWLTLLVGIG
jgi:hypothetical protein